MKAGAPRRSEDPEPSSGETTDNAARKSGLSLNEWVGRLMGDNARDSAGADEAFTEPSTPAYQAPRPVADETERPADPTRSAESRQALAVNGIERSVDEVIERIDAGER